MKWKKLLSFFIIVAMIVVNISTFNSNAQNEDYDSDYIKIGLKQNLGSKSSIRLDGDGFSIGTENGEISKLFDINDQNIIAKLGNFSYHIEISQNFSSYREALEKSKGLNTLGVNSYIVYRNGFKVYIGEFGSESSANGFLSTNTVLGSESTVILRNEPLVTIENINGQKIISFDKSQRLYIKSLSDVTKIEKQGYRGFVSFTNNGSKITAINYVKLGDYLKGVVPNEMPALWNIEALKAQAVAARNYTLRNLAKHKAEDYNLCDTTHCQAYGGYDKEHPNSTRAVEETKNKVLKYNGTIVETVYSACNGGYTASNEDVWSGSPIAYLREKVDPYSVDTPHSNWTYEISKAEASNKLKASGYDVGQIISIETKTSALGARIIELKVTGTSGTKIIPKGKVQNIFGSLKSTNYKIGNSSQTPTPAPVPTPSNPDTNNDVYVLSGNDIKSKKVSLNNINIITAEGVKKLDSDLEKVVISNGVETKPQTPSVPVAPSTPNNVGEKIVIKGSGYGHGVGMSQNGANNMAKAGFSYKEILEFYYTGSRVE